MKANKATRLAAITFLKQHPMAVLSTVSSEKQPWGAAIYYIADGDFTFYFVTKSGTHKYKNIEASLYAALTVADPKTQTTVQAVGPVTPVTVKSTIDSVYKMMAAQRPTGNLQWLPPLLKIHAGEFIVLRLSPSYAQYANYLASQPGHNPLSTLVSES